MRPARPHALVFQHHRVIAMVRSRLVFSWERKRCGEFVPLTLVGRMLKSKRSQVDLQIDSFVTDCADSAIRASVRRLVQASQYNNDLA